MSEPASLQRVGILTFEYDSIACGGMGAVVTSLARSLDPQRFKPVVILPRSGRYPAWPLTASRSLQYVRADCYDDNGVEVWLLSNNCLNSSDVYPEPYGYTGIKKTDEYGERVAELLPHLGLDILHLHDAYGYKCLGQAKQLRLPTLLTVHRLHEDEPPLSFAETAALKIVEAVSVVSDAYRSERPDVFDAVDGVTVVENGIDLDFWTNPKLTTGRHSRRRHLTSQMDLEDLPTFAFVGRLDRDQKGVDVLVHALDLEGPLSFNFVFAGTGDVHLRKTIDTTVGKHPQRVRAIQRHLLPAEVRDLLGAVDSIVIPSVYEPFGLILIEAMAMGALPIASDTGGLAAVLGRRSLGELVVPADPFQLRSAINRVESLILANEPLLQSHRLELAAVAAEYSAQRMASGYQELYEALSR